MVRPEDQRLLQPFLLAGKRLLWAGRPRRGLILRASDFYLAREAERHRRELFGSAVDDPLFTA